MHPSKWGGRRGDRQSGGAVGDRNLVTPQNPTNDAIPFRNQIVFGIISGSQNQNKLNSSED